MHTHFRELARAVRPDLYPAKADWGNDCPRAPDGRLEDELARGYAQVSTSSSRAATRAALTQARAVKSRMWSSRNLTGVLEELDAIKEQLAGLDGPAGKENTSEH